MRWDAKWGAIDAEGDKTISVGLMVFNGLQVHQRTLNLQPSTCNKRAVGHCPSASAAGPRRCISPRSCTRCTSCSSHPLLSAGDSAAAICAALDELAASDAGLGTAAAAKITTNLRCHSLPLPLQASSPAAPLCSSPSGQVSAQDHAKLQRLRAPAVFDLDASCPCGRVALFYLLGDSNPQVWFQDPKP